MDTNKELIKIIDELDTIDQNLSLAIREESNPEDKADYAYEQGRVAAALDILKPMVRR